LVLETPEGEDARDADDGEGGEVVEEGVQVVIYQLVLLVVVDLPAVVLDVPEGE
jgi:hypothetical protein